jgi:hypothetical protein
VEDFMQTIHAMSGVNCVVEVSADGAVWHNISGSSNQVSAVEQARMSGQAYTFEGDVAIVTAAKREPIELSIRVLYTEIATEAWERIRVFFEAAGGTRIWVRWQLLPGLGQPRFTVQEATVSRFQYADAVADDPNPVVSEMVFRCPEVNSDYNGGAPLYQRVALAEFYAAFGGAGWGTSTNWLTPADVDDWYGVATDGFQVIEIDLANNGLTNGSLPVAWAEKFPGLRNFSVNQNGLAAVTIDSIVEGFFGARARFLWAVSRLLDLGGNNAAPTGAVQAPSPCPAATPGQMIYELAHDSCGDGHETWTVVYDGASQIP